MSAVPSPILQDVETSGGSPKLATRAAVYFFVVAALATAISLPLLSRLSPHTPGWTTFVILGTIAAVGAALRRAHAAEPVVPHDHRLPDPGRDAAPAGARRADRRRSMHIPEWLKNRSAWYIQIFNICNWTLAMLAACASLPRHRLRLGSGQRRPLRARRPRGRRRRSSSSTTS